MAQDYTWLQAKITRYIRRTDLAADIPDFIAFAEKRISSDLMARLQNITTTLQTAAAEPGVQLPGDFSAERALSVPSYGALTYLTPSALAARYVDRETGIPRNYTIEGDQLVLGPIPDGAYTLNFVYRGEIPPLASAANGVNWLITDHPEIYLAASMCEAFLAVRDQANLQVWESKYRNAVDILNTNDWNSAGDMAVRSDAATP